MGKHVKRRQNWSKRSEILTIFIYPNFPNLLVIQIEKFGKFDIFPKLPKFLVMSHFIKINHICWEILSYLGKLTTNAQFSV